jgi:hypothetical protein
MCNNYMLVRDTNMHSFFTVRPRSLVTHFFNCIRLHSYIGIFVAFSNDAFYEAFNNNKI